MSRKTVLYTVLFVTIGLVAVIGWGQIRTPSPSPQTQSNGEATKTPPRDPCWFVSLRDPAITPEMTQKRKDLQIRGYSEEITLAEAVRTFNQEKQCDANLAPYPLLTEEEVLAAIVAGPGYDGVDGESWTALRSVLYKIVRDKKMPKGSLLVATGGPNISGSILRPDGSVKAKGIEIAMFIGLEHHEFGQKLRPDQIFEIRRTYFSFESVK